MIIQILNTVNAGVHVAVGLGLPELPIPAHVPEIPVVRGIGLGQLEFDVLVSPADDHALTGFECFRPTGQCHLGPSLPHGDSHPVKTDDFDPVAAVLFRTHRRQRGFDIDVCVSAPQFAVSEGPALQLNSEGSMGEIGQSNRGVFVEA